MPNRHDRRAAEAEARRNFEKYQSLYRRAYKAADDREIGEAWMRGEAFEAGGMDMYVIHPVGEIAKLGDDDIRLSARYETQTFKACAAPRHLPAVIDDWSRFFAYACAQISPADESIQHLLNDERSAARETIFQFTLENKWQADPQLSALIAGAIAWLASTATPLGLPPGTKGIHYEITDLPPDASGRMQRNFRLMLSGEPN